MTLIAPTENDTLQPLIGQTIEGLKRIAFEEGLKPYAASQIARWLYVRRATSINAMTDLPKTARENLEKKYSVGRYEPSKALKSTDGTIKYLFEVGDKNVIESVYIPDYDRATLCVSSQIGCRMGCHFCMTGKQGFKGNLTTREIINQVLSIPESDKLTNIVFMGMGEPLDNMDNMLKVIQILTAQWGMAWSPRRITVSTVGRHDNLKTLLDKTQVHIAISIHSPFSMERQSLMPIEKAYPITDIISTLRQYDFSRQRRCSFEYIVWKGINDDSAHALALARLLSQIKGVRVNLIRYHHVPGLEPMLRPASENTMEEFRDILNSKGIIATIRRSRGEDIMAACGQLAGKLNNN